MYFSYGDWKVDGIAAIPIVLFIVGMFGYGVMSAVQDIIALIGNRK